MRITDAPFAAGTLEHSAWVREVFIPTVSATRTLEDRAKFGAESIGATLTRSAFRVDLRLIDEFTRSVQSLVDAFATIAPILTADFMEFILTGRDPELVRVRSIVAFQRRRRHK